MADLLEAPLYIQGASYPSSADRSLIRLMTNGAAIGQPGDMAVTANGTPNMSVNVAAGHAVVPRSGGSFGDAYTAENQASPQNLTIAAADPTNPRYDWIIVKIYDQQYSGTLNKGTLEVVTGIASSTPQRPTIAAGTSYVLLAELYVTAGKTSIVSGDITDKRPLPFAPPGGFTICTSTTRPAVQAGVPAQIYETDTRAYGFWDVVGGTWRMFDSVYQTFTPVLLASTTNPALGTSSQVYGRYVRRGGWLDVDFLIQFGTSGQSAGSGTYQMKHPAGLVGQPAHYVAPRGTVIINGSMSTIGTIQSLADFTGVTFSYMSSLTAISPVTNSAPFVWTTPVGAYLAGSYSVPIL